MPAKIDLAGRKFGKLTAVEPTRDRFGVRAWKCSCLCGNVVTAVTRALTSGRVAACPDCGGPVPGRGSSARLCGVCGKDFEGATNALFCSGKCRLSRRRGLEAGVFALGPPMRKCEICAKDFAIDRGLKFTCSKECLRERRQRRYREDYYRRAALDPELCSRANARRRERAAVDPVYAEKLRGWEEKRRSRHRERMRADPEYAVSHRSRGNDHYKENREKIQNDRRIRLDSLSPEDLARWIDRARAYARNWRRKIHVLKDTDPVRCQRYLDTQREFHRRANAQKLLSQANRLHEELLKRLERTHHEIDRSNGNREAADPR